MRFLITCGGTGGHINPAIAVANYIKEQQPDAEILFVGGTRGMEGKLVPEAGYPLKVIPLSGISRSLSLNGLKANVRCVKNLLASYKRADAIIDDFRPDAIFGTGGYVCYPLLYRGAKKKIPAIVHESNAKTGLAVKRLAPHVDKILVAFTENQKDIKQKEKIILTGNPIRQELLTTTGADAKNTLGYTGKPVILSFWGSLGADFMNKIMVDFIERELLEKHFYHIHATGARSHKQTLEALAQKGIYPDKEETLDLREYIYDMNTAMAAADIVLSRAGALTCGELQALRKPAILIPSPNVTDNHQEKNARSLEKSGSVLMMLERDCTAEGLYNAVTTLLSDKEALAAMASAAENQAITDGTARIYKEIMACIKTA